MIEGRPYQEKRTHAEALKEIIDNAGSAYDPDVVKAFISLFDGSQEKINNPFVALERQTSSSLKGENTKWMAVTWAIHFLNLFLRANRLCVFNA